MNRTLKRGVGNRSLAWHQGPVIRRSLNQHALNNAEYNLYTQLSNRVYNQGMDPTEIMREINASNTNKGTKKKLAKHWLRNMKNKLSPSRIHNTIRQVYANRNTKTRRRR